MSTPALPDAAHKLGSESQWAVETHGLTKRFAGTSPSTVSSSSSPGDVRSATWGRTAPARPRSSGCCSGSPTPTPARCPCSGTPFPSHRDLALARVGAIVDEPRFHGHLTGRQNLQILAAAREPAARDRIGPIPRTGGHRPPGRRQGVEVLDGHAPAPRGGRLSARATPSSSSWTSP